MQASDTMMRDSTPPSYPYTVCRECTSESRNRLALLFLDMIFSLIARVVELSCFRRQRCDGGKQRKCIRNLYLLKDVHCCRKHGINIEDDFGIVTERLCYSGRGSQVEGKSDCRRTLNKDPMVNNIPRHIRRYS